MNRLAKALVAALALCSSAFAQGGGPGPIPSPLQINGASVFLPGQQCIVMPQSVTGGCKGNNTINAAGVFVNGSAVLTQATGSSLTVGASAVLGGTSTRVLFDNAGVLGEYTQAQLTAQINPATASLPGTLPAWPNNTTTFFRGDGTYSTLNFAAIAGSVSAAQMPALTGDVTSSAGTVATTVAAIQSKTVSGTTGTVNVVFSTSPTLTTPVLGVAQATSLAVTGTGGAGFVEIPTNTAPTAPASGIRIYTNGGGLAWVQQSDGFVRVLSATLTANRTYTFPDATATMAALSVAQTWTATQSFGTIAAGSWQGTAVALGFGGTNNALTASNGGIIWSDASKLNILAGTVTAGQCLLSGSSAAPTWGSCAGGAAVSSVTNSDGTLMVSPTTGAVVASIALGHANTWTAAETNTTAPPQIILGVNTTTGGAIKFFGSTSGNLTLQPAAAAGSGVTMTIPGVTDTLAVLGTNQTLSATETFSGTLSVTGTLNVSGALATLSSNGTGTIGATTTAGIVMRGQGSTSDVSIQNKSGTAACTVPTGTTTLNCTGLQVGGVSVSTTTGTVTSVATAGLATGGPITSTGTVTVTAAVKSDQTTGSSTSVAVVPGVQQFHDSAAKAWLWMTQSGGTYTNAASYGVTSFTKNGTGDVTVTFSTAFTSANYSCVASTASSSILIAGINKSTTAIEFILAVANTGVSTDTNFNVACYGRQ